MKYYKGALSDVQLGKYGYSGGYYEGMTCNDCGERFGGAKRCYRCGDCAEIAFKHDHPEWEIVEDMEKILKIGVDKG